MQLSACQVQQYSLVQVFSWLVAPGYEVPPLGTDELPCAAWPPQERQAFPLLLTALGIKFWRQQSLDSFFSDAFFYIKVKVHTTPPSTLYWLLTERPGVVFL